jgi:arginase family enzyme
VGAGLAGADVGDRGGLTSVNLVGGDIVEVAPPYDHAEITCIAAATVVFDLITLMAKRHSSRGD